ncbi:hypothetical protein BN970_02801 [Mycolicibacterium conceptionense]|uniref:Uncharacterized protein n=1 Tax=Mycolicibacterium conceptionense TaxID=451644 RepID=A0A0U1DE31_9MYCO|nr:hypothetical protein BN970_02801 [Mycolicibacterium conceptionense]
MRYPVLAAATASSGRPASPHATTTAQAVTAPTMAGRASRFKALDAATARSGSPIAAQYTV